MILQDSKGSSYIQFSSLEKFPITQAIFTRKGGNSKFPWKSLNIGNTVGDNPGIVKKNIRIILNVLGYQVNQLAQVRQVHSARVEIIQGANVAGNELIHADAMVTDQPQVLLLMRFADCVPILLYDPVKNTVGIGHAGWKGTVSKIGLAMVRNMEQEYGTRPQDIIAGIGPSIGPDHYQIGEDVSREIQEAFPSQWQMLLEENNDGVKLDLWKANSLTLSDAGVKRIEIAGICTACHLEDWFSHRGESGRTGRFAAAIGII